jgi:hypothetical protein
MAGRAYFVAGTRQRRFFPQCQNPRVTGGLSCHSHIGQSQWRRLHTT